MKLAKAVIFVGIINFLTIVSGDMDQCREDIAYYHSQFSQLDFMARKMWDANGKIPTDGMLSGNFVSLGSYTSCLEVDFDETIMKNRTGEDTQKSNFYGKYCLTQSTPQSPEEEDLDRELPDRILGERVRSLFPFTTGNCYPSTCTNEDISQILTERHTNDSGYEERVISCEASRLAPRSEDLFTPGEIAMISILSLIVFLIIVGTCVQAICLNFLPEKEQGIFVKFFTGFSLYQNIKILFNTEKKSGKSMQLYCLNGLRFLSATWVVVIHVEGLMRLYLPKTNIGYVTEIYDNFAYRAILNATFSVDTFFFLSGLLVTYVTFKEIDRREGSLLFLPKFYIHRFIRITATYAIVVGFHATLIRFISVGPINQVETYFVEGCQAAWWRNLIYINNLDMTEYCLGHTWYLGADMQMYWISPLMFVPIWYLLERKKSFLWAAIYGAVWIVTSTLIPTIMTLTRDWPASASQSIPRHLDFMEDNYIVPWCRFQPYAVGIVMGILLHKTRDSRIKLSPVVVIGGWILAFGLGFAVVYGITGDPRDPSSEAVAVLYGGFNRLAWGTALAWVVFACVNGYGGWINSFLSWEAFMPLARISFVLYLIHYSAAHLFIWQMTFESELTYILVTVFVSSIVAFSVVISVITVLLIELPFSALEKLILRR